MGTQVNLHEAKTNLSRLVARAEAGEEIILARAGKPAARLVPIASPVPMAGRRFGMLQHLDFKVPEDFNTMGHAEIEAMFYGDTLPEATPKPRRKAKR